MELLRKTLLHHNRQNYQPADSTRREAASRSRVEVRIFISDSVREVQRVSECVRECQALSNIVRECQILSGNVRNQVTESVRECQIASGSVRECHRNLLMSVRECQGVSKKCGNECQWPSVRERARDITAGHLNHWTPGQQAMNGV